MSGDEPASDGNVVINKGARVGVLRQDRFMNDEEPILDVSDGGATSSMLTKALADLKTETDPRDGSSRSKTSFARTTATRSKRALERHPRSCSRHSDAAAHRMPLRHALGRLQFSLRVLLAQVLLGGPDVLLLDEPTNHLDILSIRWLEKFLAGYKGCAVVISHDQRFLDNIATDILDVDYGTITESYPGQLLQVCA